jgi:hypothetical protein
MAAKKKMRCEGKNYARDGIRHSLSRMPLVPAINGGISSFALHYRTFLSVAVKHAVSQAKDSAAW